MKLSQSVDKNLWLVHLVQLKKLFLKLSAYVELYLKQDWSLLPVPDFKLVARSEETTSHLNFMVATVLLTATHSGKNVEYEKILEFAIPSSLRKDIQLIEDAFSMALEPKSPKSSTNSPRRTSLTVNNSLGIVPKVLFPSTLSSHVDDLEIKVQDIQETEVSKTDHQSTTITNIMSETITVTSNSSELIDLQNEVKMLEIKISEKEKLLQKSKDSVDLHAETVKNLAETRLKLFEALEEVCQLKERQEYEKIERYSLMAAFDQERQVLEDKIELLSQENDEISSKLTNLSHENEVLNETIRLKDGKIQELEIVQEQSHQQQQEVDQSVINELNESKIHNSKLVKALKKARDHIINQDLLLKELRTALQASELQNSAMLEEVNSLKSSYENERISMNRVLTDLGASIQRSHL